MKNIFITAGVLLLIFFIQSCKKDGDNTSKDPEITATDIDGNVYTGIKIGTQVWMVENLKTTKYNNGDLIGTTIPSTKDISAENKPEYQWASNDNELNVTPYGRLYTWYAATDSRGICPTGWHVPTDNEWVTLIDFWGGYIYAARYLKESGTTHWKWNIESTNFSGFTALPAGYHSYTGPFWSFGTAGNWWSSTENKTGTSLGKSMNYASDIVNDVGLDIAQGAIIKAGGNSVRCIRDN